MSTKAWQHVVVHAPLDVAVQVLPDHVHAGPATLEITPERLFVARPPTPDSRRYRAIWRTGRREAEGYVELVPHTNEWTTELIVHVQAGGGVLSRLAWTQPRLQRAALGLALAMRYEMDRRATYHPDRPRTPVPAWVRTLEPRTA